MTNTFQALKNGDCNSPVIALRNVSKIYGPLHAVDGINLEISRGEIVGLIGHNGAGKSTLFKMMLGLISATQGEIYVNGQAVKGKDFRATRRHIGYLPENVVLYDNLCGLETLHFFARLKGAAIAQCAEILERVGLTHAGKRPVREYSKGMRQRLGFAQALLGQPRVLFLDEPTNGLDPLAIRDFYATLRTLQQQGVTVVITSHILSELQERVDRLAILSSGKLQALGSIQALREQSSLPLIVEVDVAPAHQPVALQALHAATGLHAQTVASGVYLECPRAQKMAVLASLATLGERVGDLRLHEPTLEDMFFGLSA
ncbi:MAG TPA: ABC transporter ATP-binding protein [Comamonas sp.]